MKTGPLKPGDVIGCYEVIRHTSTIKHSKSKGSNSYSYRYEVRCTKCGAARERTLESVRRGKTLKGCWGCTKSDKFLARKGKPKKHGIWIGGETPAQGKKRDEEFAKHREVRMLWRPTSAKGRIIEVKQ